MPDSDSWAAQINSVGAFIRRQRNLADLSLRELADLASVSNAYLSQIERGLHEPSVRVLRSVALALNVSAETLLAQAGLLDHFETGEDSESTAPRRGSRAELAIRADPGLTEAQKEALLAVYMSFIAGTSPATVEPPPAGPATRPPSTTEPAPAERPPAPPAPPAAKPSAAKPSAKQPSDKLAAANPPPAKPAADKPADKPPTTRARRPVRKETL